MKSLEVVGLGIPKNTWWGRVVGHNYDVAEDDGGGRRGGGERGRDMVREMMVMRVMMMMMISGLR